MKSAAGSSVVVLLVAAAVSGCDAPSRDDTGGVDPGYGAPTTPRSKALPGKVSIVNGSEVGECGYPSVGSYGYDAQNIACSLVLVAPDVVVTAAHCLEAVMPTEVHFGERHDTPAKVVPVEKCVAHPEYDGDWADIGLCVLAEPVEDIAVTPLLAGCEVDALVPGVPLEVVGFGASMAFFDPAIRPDGDWVTEGAGIKRRTSQAFDLLDLAFGQIWMLGDPELQNSSCFGDSGGPVFARLPDGSTRVVGVGQYLHPNNPDIFESPCGYGIVYQLVTPHLGWLEATSERDLTPCWTGEAWLGDGACGGFAWQPEQETGTWEEGCVGGGIEDVALLQCTPNPDSGDDGDTSDDGADDSTDDGASDGSTGGDEAGSSDGAESDDGDDVGADSTSGTGDAQIDGEGESDGCACRVQQSPAAPRGWLFSLIGLGVLGLRSRRR
jgi:MYXO-CTERM domain-containing protein